MLNDRARILLKTLVERYITDGEPVGSRTLSKHAGLDLSPASIRNIMSDLSRVAGLVMTPRRSPAFRQIEFLSLSEKRILLIIVTMEGEVENRVILTEHPVSASTL